MNPTTIFRDARTGRPHLPGLSIDAAGFRLVPTTPVIASDVTTDYSFRIVDVDGQTVTGFDVNHERRLHLIVASRNLVDFLHVHPEQDDRGTWTAELPPLPAGSYRVFADTRPTGADGITLGIDLTVVEPTRGEHLHPACPPAAQAVTAVGAFQVTMSGAASVGASTLAFVIERGGRSVVPAPYLGTSGHLVALRAGDLAYLHVHPLGDATDDDPAIRFAAEFPTPGAYRLFLDVSLDGDIHTAAFTVEVPETRDFGHGTAVGTHQGGH